MIRTTAEHPFWVQGRGWIKTLDLQIGCRLIGTNGEVSAVQEVFATGVRETVYNFRVAGYHTYFVGGDDWSFAIWAHNTTCGIRNVARARLLAQRMAAAGVPGAQRLVNQLNGNARYMSGYVFQTRRAYRYWREGKLAEIEARVSNLSQRRVDLLLRDGLRVENKSWRSFQYFGSIRQNRMISRLDSQARAYLQAPNSRLLIEFQGTIAPRVLQQLQILKTAFGNRFNWVIHN